MRFRILLLIIPFISACQSEEPGIDQVIPDGDGAFWRYEIVEYRDTVRSYLGIVDVLNGGKVDFEDRSGVLLQNRTFRYDSLRGTSREIIRKGAYFINSDKQISFFAEDFSKVFDEAFENSPLDSIARREIGGENYQRFNDYTPRWITPYKFRRSSTFSYDVHPEFPVFVRFRHEENTYEGRVLVSTFSNFLGIERVRVPFDTTVIASRIKTTTVFNFELTKNDTVRVTPFRSAVVMNDWFDEDYGLVLRDREPLSIFFPDIASRFPLIYYAGQRWELILYLPPIENS